MHRLLVVTSKGGTGKTTTVVNTAVELTRLGRRVLVVDTDPQGHVAISFASHDLDSATPLEQLIADQGLEPVAARIEIEPAGGRGLLKRRGRGTGGELAVLPCGEELNEVSAAIIASSYSVLDTILDRLEDHYDLCIIDRQGALTVAAHMAIRAADSYLFVGEPAFLGYVELIKARDQLQQLPGRGGEALAEIGYLPTRTPVRSRRLREYTAHFSEEFDPPMYVFESPIRQSEGIFDDARYGQPTAIVDPNGHGAEDYRRFATALLERLESLGVSCGAATEKAGAR